MDCVEKWHTLWVLDDDEVTEVAEKARKYARDRLVTSKWATSQK